ncbi:MAG: hypothetical protein M1819_003290 [Sarea resinae]|nr:MAG: hypothetical protein M1819_003290 [Sarea resinae]
MFAVPGWSVSSSALTRQLDPNAKPAPDSSKLTGANAVVPKVTKKRKRNNGPAVTADNLGDLWKKHIEKSSAGIEDGEAPSTSKDDKKRRKREKKDDKKEKVAESAVSKDEANARKSDVDTEDVPKVQSEKTKRRNLKKQEKKKALVQAKGDSPAPPSEAGPSTKTLSASAPNPATKLTPLQASMRQKLISARFRHLNETLYTTPSSNSLDLFSESPEMFTEYHEGFRRQVEVWPENPVDIYINTIKARGKINPRRPSYNNSKGTEQQQLQPLPRTSSTCTIADLGCGDARLAQVLTPMAKKLHLSLHSFDLQSPSPLVTKADISHLPLADSTVDLAIFCLALMGTNWVEFIDEAWRVLRWKGELWVAEIKSRFGRVGGRGAGAGSEKRVVDHSVGKRQKKPKKGSKDKKDNEAGDEADLDPLADIDGSTGAADSAAETTDVGAFVEVLRKHGFITQGDDAVDLSNKMFVRLRFVKGVSPIRGKNVPEKRPDATAAGAAGTWKKRPKMRFLDAAVADGEVDEKEGEVLKPCVYKIR